MVMFRVMLFEVYDLILVLQRYNINLDKPNLMMLQLCFLQIFDISEIVMVLKSPDLMPGLILFIAQSMLFSQVPALLVYHVRIL